MLPYGMIARPLQTISSGPAEFVILPADGTGDNNTYTANYTLLYGIAYLLCIVGEPGTVRLSVVPTGSLPPPASTTPASDDTRKWLWIWLSVGIAVAALVAIVSTLVVVIVRRRRHGYQRL